MRFIAEVVNDSYYNETEIFRQEGVMLVRLCKYKTLSNG